MTMTLVSTVTVGAGGAASIEFTSIPQTGTDLLVTVSGRADGGTDNALFYLRFNGVSTTTYSNRVLLGNGASASSSASTSQDALPLMRIDGASATANTFSNGSLYVTNYSGSTNKSLSVDSVSENNATTAQQMIVAGIWANTAAITSLSISTFGLSNFAQYSTASLYTVKNGSGGASVA